MNSTRRKLPAAPACESLEGRQLLAASPTSAMGMGMPPMGMGGPVAVADSGGWGSMPGSWSGPGNSVSAQAQAPNVTAQSTSGGYGGMAGYQGVDATAGMAKMGGMAGKGGMAVSGSMFPGSDGPDIATGSDVTDAMFPDSVTVGSNGTPSPLQADLEKLDADQQAIHDKSNVTPAMEAKVRNDIKAIKGAETTTPDATALATLQRDTNAAWANPGGPTDAQLSQIQADQDAVYKSQGVSAGLITRLDTDRQAIKTAAGVNDADRATIAADQKAVEADKAALAPATPTTTTPVLAATQTTQAAPPASTPAAPPVLAATQMTQTTPATTATPTTLATSGTIATPAAVPATPAAVPAIPSAPTSAMPGAPAFVAQGGHGGFAAHFGHRMPLAFGQTAGTFGRSSHRRHV